jgi:hypothetical protein
MIHQSKLSQRELERFIASPHPDGLPIQEKFADNYQALRFGLGCVFELIHEVFNVMNPLSRTGRRGHSRRRVRCGLDPVRDPG